MFSQEDAGAHPRQASMESGMTASTRPNTRSSTASGVTWAQACRDIVITSINRGQLPVLGLIAVMLLLVWKMTPEAASTLLVEVWRDLRYGQMWTYPVLGISLGGWFFHAKSQRRWFSEEMDRVGREKTALQSSASGTRFKSSNRK